MTDNRAYDGGDDGLVLSVQPHSDPSPPGSSSHSAGGDTMQDMTSSKQDEAGVGANGEAVVTVEHVASVYHDKPYPGMGKEDLLRFSDTPFWNRFRTTCVVLFWLVWLALLGTVIGLTITYPRCQPAPATDWWQNSVFYQIYVRSFYDSDGDGIGDINGVTSKLDYLEDISVEGIILNSIYDTSTADSNPDYGYQVIDYKAVFSEIGTEADLSELIKQAHDRDIQVVLEFIPNYTSNLHPWFTQSSTSSDPTSNPYWNYYVWADCSNGQQPTNWKTIMGDPGWNGTTTGRTSDCYLHQFMENQPELNLRSGQVQAEIQDIMLYWLNLGVDGFLINNANYLVEDADLRDEPVDSTCTNANAYYCQEPIYTASLPDNYNLVASWRNLLDTYGTDTGRPRVLLTDANVPNVNKTMDYYGTNGRDGANLPLNFQLTRMSGTCDGACAYRLVDNWIYNKPSEATANWMTGTSNLTRIANAATQNRVNLIQMLMLTLPGATITYYGEEIGMNDYDDGTIRDPWGMQDPTMNRDPYRTVMQWDETQYAGFCNESAAYTCSTPDMAVNPDYGSPDNRSVKAQNESANADTSYKLYRSLARLHKTDDAMQYGHIYYAYLDSQILSYVRYYEGSNRYLCVFNFGSSASEDVDYEAAYYLLPSKADVQFTTNTTMLGDFSVGDSVSLSSLTMGPGEGAIFSWAFTR